MSPLSALPILTAAAVERALWNPAELLCSKPTMWPNPRTLADATWNFTVDATTNAIHVTIKHKPVAGITVDQLVWLHNNKDKVVRDPRPGGQCWQT